MITNLLIKRSKGDALTPTSSLEATLNGITSNVPCGPLRHVLILPRSTLDRFGLPAGQLRENVVVDHPDLHDLPSGTVLRIGSVTVRLTFHCEPCGRVIDKARASDLLHHRGYLGQIVDGGRVSVGDSIKDLGVQFDAIPYAVKDRIRWALERQEKPVKAADLLFACGIPVCYSRALPKLLRTLPEHLGSLVMFESHRARDNGQMALV
jgi:hypothetical protein